MTRFSPVSFCFATAALSHFSGFFAYDYVWFVFITWLPGYLVLERQFTNQEMALYSSIHICDVRHHRFSPGLSDWLIKRVAKKDS